MLVNLAGVDLEAKAEEFGEDDWQKVIDINLSGAFWLSQAAGQAMIDGGRGGRIIQFSSTRSVAGGRRGFAAYSASKAGVNALVRQLATEWGPHGITVNGVAPGFVPTELVQDALGNPQFVQMMLRRIPFGRFGDPGRDGGRGALLRLSRRELRNGAGAVRGRRRNGKLLGGRVEQGEDRVHRARGDGRGNGRATGRVRLRARRLQPHPLEGGAGGRAGRRVADSPADAAREADVVMMSLADQNVVEEIVFGDDGVASTLRQGGYIVDMSTVPPTLRTASSERAPSTAGHKALDACVLGSAVPRPLRRAARDGRRRRGRLRARLNAIFETIGKEVTYLGGNGMGATMKLVLNMLMGVQMPALAEAVVFGERAGLTAREDPRHDRQERLQLAGHGVPLHADGPAGVRECRRSSSR